ncbi:non-hydrolyzing UDP-N-acetylglucosamine 2-epimerase [Pseudomaricurvus alcaniphilus]|uniref:non-hydrolyzing UDP-N-acetylglucosamine 2-epimerase n=1 Tax=Pseudomaricurvus alcaniphilus TaxID=1166482 RepID=UPI0031329BBC
MVTANRQPANPDMKTLLCVVGARPNFMKIAPIMRALKNPIYRINAKLLHTGQHYDADMKTSFFDQLAIPEPDIDLGVGSGSHAVQTADIMKRFEPILDELLPDAVLVVGDVNSTIACALVAVKKNIPVVHVESGLRSNDRSMPEEINRILTDQLSDILFTTERCALTNLTREGISANKVCFVGNVMIDTLRHNLPRAAAVATTLGPYANEDQLQAVAEGYGLMTLHRPSNVDDPAALARLLGVLSEISQRLPLVFPVHPRTRNKIAEAGLEQSLKDNGVILLPPMGYLEMLGLMQDAKVVLTDSGGIQEETTALGVPCITLRENTERPITIAEGTNTLAGSDPDAIRKIFEEIMSSGGKAGAIPEYWDGRAAERIAERLQEWLHA